MNDYVVDMTSVSKRFPLLREKPGFKEFVINIRKFLRRARQDYFLALKEVNVRIRRGECVGVIGGNGAGKSTLLSLILGTTAPSSGQVRVSEKATPLLQLGAGFHPDLTGKENVLINGVLLGMTRDEISRRMDSIVAFSDLHEFIDMPSRTYSSGMYMRLAFSIAIHTDPKLLLLDEILSVGDESFQKKSKQALLELINKGVTTVFVSHNLPAVEEICHRVIWLDHGQVRADGESRGVVEQYRNMA